MTSAISGETCEARTFGPMTREMFVRYAGASGDFNPIHYDETYAQSAGFPTPFSQGMHQAALLATFATNWLGAANLRRFKVRFKELVWPGDVLTCTGSVATVVEQGTERLVTIDLTCTRQDGSVAVTGVADFSLPADIR